MKGQVKFALFVALSAGVLGTGAGAAAQERQFNGPDNARVEYAISNPNQAAQLTLADWDDHRRCDGDHDRDDRGCYVYRAPYPGYAYYGHGYYVAPAPYYPPAGWYDRDGRWHAYDRDRDRNRYRHDGDDRR